MKLARPPREIPLSSYEVAWLGKRVSIIAKDTKGLLWHGEAEAEGFEGRGFEQIVWRRIRNPVNEER